MDIMKNFVWYKDMAEVERYFSVLWLSLIEIFTRWLIENANKLYKINDIINFLQTRAVICDEEPHFHLQ